MYMVYEISNVDMVLYDMQVWCDCVFIGSPSLAPRCLGLASSIIERDKWCQSQKCYIWVCCSCHSFLMKNLCLRLLSLSKFIFAPSSANLEPLTTSQRAPTWGARLQVLCTMTPYPSPHITTNYIDHELLLMCKNQLCHSLVGDSS